LEEKVVVPQRYATPLCPQKLALTAPTTSGRLVGIVRSRTKATELLAIIIIIVFLSRALFSVLSMSRNFERKVLLDKV
jgi:hypothetical protein